MPITYLSYSVYTRKVKYNDTAEKKVLMDTRDPRFCMVNNLRQATRVLSQQMDAALSPYGMKGTQFSLLVTMLSTGVIGISQLAKVLKMERTTLTRNLKPLITKGWVSVAEGEDQRVKLVTVTNTGKEQVAAAMPAWRAQQGKLVDILGEQHWRSQFNEIQALGRL